MFLTLDALMGFIKQRYGGSRGRGRGGEGRGQAGGGPLSKPTCSNMPGLAGGVSLCVTLPERGIVPLTSLQGRLVRARARVCAVIDEWIILSNTWDFGAPAKSSGSICAHVRICARAQTQAGSHSQECT